MYISAGIKNRKQVKIVTRMNEDWNIEVHPNWYLDVSPMRSLILGSFPPHESKRIYPFFYPTARNRFWKILAELADMPLQSTNVDELKAVQERYAIMKKLEIGVQNLGLEIERKGNSALDTHIKITKYQDIVSIIDAHPELNKILLPGFSAVHSTARSFINYIRLSGIEHTEIDRFKPEASFKIHLKDRSIDCVILNSTSTASKVKYDFLLDQFRRNLA
jgi:G:T/U-mismatch repair DNA glycosylase